MNELTNQQQLIGRPHTIHECWNPHFHHKIFKEKSAKILLQTLAKKDQPAIEVVPLCYFGGRTFSPFTLSHVGGTHVLCPKCQTHDYCGYDYQSFGPSPKQCSQCKHVFNLADYFQPVISPAGRGHSLNILINPLSNPFVAVTELLAGSPNGLLKSHLIQPILIIVANENLLASATHVKSNLRQQCGVTELRFAVNWFSNWIIRDIGAWSVQKYGQIMLKRRGFNPRKKLKSRIAELSQLDQRLLQAEYLHAHYHLEKKELAK